MKEEWNQYKINKKNTFEKKVFFNKMKISFSFLIILGITDKELQETTVRYFCEDKSELKTAD
ncbi:MAG: hypothetical protein KDD45_11455 [Bdellovibrionales bacterium]|nr:hypothetical protein [Bdellovibrionales bacterium]